MLSFISGPTDTRSEEISASGRTARENSIFVILLVALLPLLKVLLQFTSILRHILFVELKLISYNNKFSLSSLVGVYSDSDGELIFLLQGQQGGVTHVMFSPDGTKLYSGGRKVKT